MQKNICLLGTAPDSFPLAPYNDESWEIWACSPGTRGAPRIDVFFELHRFEPDMLWFPPDYIQFLKEFKGDLIMADHPEDSRNAKNPDRCRLLRDTFPNAMKLPWEDLAERYGPYFWTSTLAYMLAMAIDMKPPRIMLYGVDMASQTEYYDQRSGCQYFSMLAASRGIDVSVPPESDLLRPAPMYGVCEISHVWIKQTARARYLAGRHRDAQKLIEERTHECHYLKGALDEQDWNLHSWQGGVDTLSQEFTKPPVPQELFGTEPLNPIVEYESHGSSGAVEFESSSAQREITDPLTDHTDNYRYDALRNEVVTLSGSRYKPCDINLGINVRNLKHYDPDEEWGDNAI